MKKAYVKPALYAERFSLSEHIANCTYIATWGEGNCGVALGGITVFAQVGTCSEDAVEMFQNFNVEPTYANWKELEQECYNAFTDPTSSFFTS